MNIATVADNLKRTIAGKEKMLAEYTDMRDSLSKETDLYQALYAHWHTSVEMLQINIDELKRILTDVELCMNDAAANSWAGEVDRLVKEYK